MSTTLSTTSMVADLQRRMPIGIPNQNCIDRLNEAYRWICQQAPFVWLQKVGSVSILTTALFELPASVDPGKPMYLSANGLEIPYKPWEHAVKHQTYAATATAGNYSLWSFYYQTTPTVKYMGRVFPALSAPAAPATAEFVYHELPTLLAIGASTYFPTPDLFDSFILDLAESELRRTYGYAGWEQVMQRAQGQVMNVVDAYRSTKPAMFGLLDSQRQMQEAQAEKQK